MRVNPLLSKINPNTFIEDYLYACKIEDKEGSWEDDF